MKFRKLKDALGEVNVPLDRAWGSNTQRAIENFPISGQKFPHEFLETFARVKKFCAEANYKLGNLEKKKSEAIVRACEEIIRGKHFNEFPVDVFQTGSGTSTNMNFNEVISHFAHHQSKLNIHPNDDVNKGQSSNDIFPTVLQVTAALSIKDHLLPSLKNLEKTLHKKSVEFQKIVKVGRTHLQDATPITLGQEFSGYEEQIRKSQSRIELALENILELPVGGTAVGTGINTHPQFGEELVKRISQQFKMPFKTPNNRFEAQASRDGCAELSGSLKTLAVSLTKIANDLRWLSCGPRAGIGEIQLPEVQPGSSIMPGKVNPVIPEAVLQVCAKVIGNDASITWGAASGSFELNTMMPLIASCLLESLQLLAGAIRVFESRCVRGIQPNIQRIEELLERNLMLATPLALEVGYDKAAEVAKTALKENKTIKEVAAKKLKISEKDLVRILDVKEMLKPKK